MKFLTRKTKLKPLAKLLILTTLLLVCFVPEVFATPNDLDVIISSTSGLPGDQVVVTIDLQNVAQSLAATETNGIYGSNFTITYDSTALQVGTISAGNLFTVPSDFLSNKSTLGKITLLSLDNSGGDNLITTDGTYATIPFTIKAGTPAAEYLLDFEGAVTINGLDELYAQKALSITKTLGSITVTSLTPTAPDAPTNPVQDDVNNTFGWTNVAGFTQASDYEYSVDGGTSWVTATANPQPLPDAAYAIGAVQARVKANISTSQPEGEALSSTIAFTINPVVPAAPSVSNDDEANTVDGMAAGMEYNLDSAGYVAYNATTFAGLDFAGNHTLVVRVAASGINPASNEVTLTFTVNPVVTSLTYKSVDIDSTNKIVTLTFNDNIANNTADLVALKNAITFAADGTTFNPLSESDTVTISGKTLVITFDTALLESSNTIKLEANTLKDLGDEVLETEVTAGPISTFDECFIATAAFGSKNQSDVVLLRQFRDQFLLTNPIGQLFVETYYNNSPPIAQFIAGNTILKFVTRVLLLPFVAIVYLLFHPVLLVGVLAALAFLLVQRRRRKVVLGSR